MNADVQPSDVPEPELESELEPELPQLRCVPPDELLPPFRSARHPDDDLDLDLLADSLKQHGMLQPILAQRTSRGLETIIGERRRRAALLAKLPLVPVLIAAPGSLASAADIGAVGVSLLDNLHHLPLEALDQADAIKEIQKSGLSLAAIASALSTSVRRLKWILSRRNIPDALRKMLRSGLLTPDERILSLNSDCLPDGFYDSHYANPANQPPGAIPVTSHDTAAHDPEDWYVQEEESDQHSDFLFAPFASLPDWSDEDEDPPPPRTSLRSAVPNYSTRRQMDFRKHGKSFVAALNHIFGQPCARLLPRRNADNGSVLINCRNAQEARRFTFLLTGLWDPDDPDIAITYFDRTPSHALAVEARAETLAFTAGPNPAFEHQHPRPDLFLEDTLEQVPYRPLPSEPYFYISAPSPSLPRQPPSQGSLSAQRPSDQHLTLRTGPTAAPQAQLPAWSPGATWRKAQAALQASRQAKSTANPAPSTAPAAP